VPPSPGPPGRTDIPTDGPALIDLAPGSYCLRVNKFDTADPPRSIAFPAIVAVTVPRSTTTVNQATVVAPLPALRPTLTGRLVAQNTLGGVVELVASPAPVLTSTFTQNVSVAVGGTTIPNLNPNSTGTRTATASPPVIPPAPAEQTDFAWTYELTDVPVGENRITAPVITGYTPLTPTTQTIANVSEFGPTPVADFVYTLASAPVEIALGDSTFPSLDPAFSTTDARATVRLFSKSGSITDPPRNYSFVAATNTLIINDVAPEPGNWTLTFDDALHAPFTDDKVKIAQQLTPDGRRVGTLQTTPVGDRTRLTGLATEQPAVNASSIAGLSGDAAMTLVGSTETYVLRPNPTSATGPNSPGAKLVPSQQNPALTTYIFDVVPGTYTLTTTKTDFIQQQLVDLPLTPAGTVLAGQNVAIRRQATVTVTALNRGLALPSDLRIDLLNTGNDQRYGPTAVPATPTTNPSVAFNVPSGTYRARTFSDVYPQQTSSPDSGIGIGATTNINLTLPRVTRFNVSGPPSASVAIPTLTADTPLPATSGTTIVFTDTTTTGTLQATVTATGHRTRRVTVPAELSTTTAVTLLPNVTVSGSITGASNGTIVATNAANSSDTRSGTITGGTYSIAGLDVNNDGTDKTWNISYTEVGVGTGSTSLVVSGTSPAAETRSITLAPRPVNYNFTVTTGASTAVPDASVTLSPSPTPAPPATSASGTSTAVVDENVAFTWTVKKAGFLTRYGSFTRAPSHPNVAVPVPMVAGISGTVRDGGTGVVGATVEVCPDGATAACAPGASRTFTSGANGAFTITSDLTPGDYTVVAFTTGAGAKQGTVTLTIETDGTASLSSTVVALA
jgi:hypothetical protein